MLAYNVHSILFMSLLCAIHFMDLFVLGRFFFFVLLSVYYCCLHKSYTYKTPSEILNTFIVCLQSSMNLWCIKQRQFCGISQINVIGFSIVSCFFFNGHAMGLLEHKKNCDKFSLHFTSFRRNFFFICCFFIHSCQDFFILSCHFK